MMKFITALLLLSSSAYGLNDVDKAQVWQKNLLVNPGFENGKSNWTASAGALSIANSSSYSSFWMTGKTSVIWNASASTQTLSSSAVTIPQGLYGKNGVVACKIVVPSGTATHTLEAYDGSTVLGAVTVSAGTTPTYNYVNFIFPSSGTIRARLQAQADEPAIGIDDCFQGDASEINLTNISQAQFIGSAYIATTSLCTGWTRTNTALGAVASDTDCPGPTVEFNPGPGVIQTTDTDLPKFTVNNLPPGYYRVVMKFRSTRAAGTTIAAAINDGTTTSGQATGQGSSGESSDFTIEGFFTYTSAGNRSFELYIASASGATTVPNAADLDRISFSISRYPLSTEQAYRPEVVPFYWQGYHDSTCSWSYTATTLATPSGDSSCTLSESYNTNAGSITSTATATGTVSLTPGIAFTASTPGKYEVCADLSLQPNNIVHSGWRLTNGPTDTTVYGETMFTGGGGSYRSTPKICGIFNATSPGTSFTPFVRGLVNSNTYTLGADSTYSPTYGIKWVIKKLDQPIPAPILTNSVSSPYNGIAQIVAGLITYSAGTPAITSQTGSWMSSVSDNSAGDTTITVAAGTFSARPWCTCTSEGSGVTVPICTLDTTTAISSTAIRVQMVDNGGSAGDPTPSFNIICIGPK